MVLKVMLVKGIEQRYLFLLYQNVILTVIDYGLGFTTTTTTTIRIRMYIYNALMNALSAHMVHINLNMIFYTHVEHSPTKTTHAKHHAER